MGLLAVRICVSLVWRSSPNNHSVTGTLAEQRSPYSLFSWGLMFSLRSWTISKLAWPRSCIASVACTSKLCSSLGKVLSALADRLSSDSAGFNTTQPAFFTLLCRRENPMSRDLALQFSPDFFIDFWYYDLFTIFRSKVLASCFFVLVVTELFQPAGIYHFR